MVVHNETSTGVDQPDRRHPQGDRPRGHPALFMVDTISSLGSIDYRHDEWGVDVTVGWLAKRPDAAAGPRLQRGLREGAAPPPRPTSCRAPTGTGTRCIEAQRGRLLPLHAGDQPALRPAAKRIAMLLEEGLDKVFARHQRHAAATRAAVAHWGLEVLCLEPAEYSPVADGRDDAARATTPTRSARWCSTIRHVARLRAGEARGQGVPHRSSRRLQRAHADGHAVRRGDGSRRRAACRIGPAASRRR